jgi:anaerobic magnesium-protoporphyrin IX monomethyl ester cyclase
MAKVAFIQHVWHTYTGTMSLGAFLAAKGHACSVFVADKEGDLQKALENYDPDLLAFSCLTGGHQTALASADQLKSHLGLPVIFGGMHPTIFPEVLARPQVDFICLGEGEYALAELVADLEKGGRGDGVPGIWCKRDGEVVRNPIRPLIEDLGKLPPPDWSLYLCHDFFRENPTKHFMIGRGCPYHCTFCYNDALRRLCPTRGAYVRLRPANQVIREICTVRERSPLRTVVFDDDTFTHNRPWLKDFLPAYRQQVGLPFVCNVRAEQVTPEIVGLLAQAGCFRVCMGIESGSEVIRRQVLNKHFSNEQVVRAARLLKDHGIKILTNNMLGIPDETLEQALETVRLNIRIRTDYPWCAIYQPYPRTPLADYAVSKGYLKQVDPDAFKPTFFEESLLQLRDIKAIVRLQKLFYLAVVWPWSLPLIRKVVRWPLDRFYHLVFLLTFAYRYMRSNQLSMLEMIRFARRSMGLYGHERAG